jgi:hypothetical protein
VPVLQPLPEIELATYGLKPQEIFEHMFLQPYVRLEVDPNRHLTSEHHEQTIASTAVESEAL